MIVSGKVHRYGDDVNTDVIFPGKYTYSVSNPEEMASHAMEDIDPEFVKRVENGDVVVAGKNFGCGSSRQQAVSALKYAGIRAVIAKSFSRIYYRNCINLGLFALTLPELVENATNGDAIRIDTEMGIVYLGEREFAFPAPPPYIHNIIKAGGLIPFVKEQLKNKAG